MSRTTVCITGRDGEVHEGRCFPNLWDGAWFVWDALWRTYVDADGLTHASDRTRLWALADDPRLTADERIALITTFDYAMIRKEECLQVAGALDRFAAHYERRRGRTSSLVQQAQYLRELAAHPDVREVCWQASSSAEWLWETQQPDRVGVEETRPYNVRTDTRHWFLFDRYPHLKADSARGLTP